MPRNLRSSDAARLQTRANTALLDGDLKKRRQQAEQHMAKIVLRSAIVKAGKQKFSIPRNKLREVFNSMTSRVYTGYECKLSRVKGLVYATLNKRNEEMLNDYVSDDEDIEVVEEVSVLFLKIYVCSLAKRWI